MKQLSFIIRIFFLFILMFISISGFSQTQISTDAVFFKNNLKIVSKEMNFYSKENKAIFSGNVRVHSDSGIMYCDKLYVYFNKKNSDFERIEAKQNVRIITDDITIECNTALYSPEEAIILMKDNPVLYIENNTFQSKRIVMDLEKSKISLEGSVEAKINLKQENGK